MTNEVIVYGEMGKGGKGGHTPVESNDTLRSTQTVRLLLAISEGEIESVDNIYLNRVAISEYTASYAVRTGTTNQTVIPGFVDTETTLPAFTSMKITTSTPSGPHAIPSDVDALRFTFFTPALSHYLENGDLVGSAIQLSIQYSLNGTNWTQARLTTKSGKASSQYAWDVKIDKPAGVVPGSTWYVKVTRVTPDSATVKTSNDSHISNITQIYYKNLNYPGTALVAITLSNADQFGGQVPEIMVKGKFIKVRIPSNYNPTTRVYTGSWDLTFNPVLTYTANIAWVIFFLLNSNKCLGISEAEIDKASFYMLSQYADTMVSDGKGGTIPRYHVGIQNFARENVPSFLANYLSLCNANLSTNALGQITIVYDHPNVVPSKIVTNANVIDGLFNYSSNDIDGRTTQVNVTFNNFEKYADTDTVSVPGATPTAFEQGLIDRYGLQVSDIVLPGCKHEAQALYKARWALYTNCKTTKFISYKVFLHGLAYYFGEIIQVMDSDNQEVMQHAVVVNAATVSSTTTITLDRSIVLSAHAWGISFTGADGTTLVHKTITQTNTTTNTVSFLGTELPFLTSTIIFRGPVSSKLYKVTGIQKDEDYYVIAAVEHDENKYSYIDGAFTIDAPTGDFINTSNFVVEPVVNLSVVPISSSNGITSNIQLNVTWDWDLDMSSQYQALFIAAWRRDNQDYTTLTDIYGKSFDIDNAVPGTYDIVVWAVHPGTGVKSNSIITTYAYKTIAGTSLLLPPVNMRITNTAGLVYSTATMSLSFDYNSANDNVPEDSLKDYVVELWNVSATTLYGTYVIEPDINRNGVFKLQLAENTLQFGTPTRQYGIKLYSRDLTGELSEAVQVTVNNTVPAAPSFTLLSGVGSTFVNITPPADTDVTGYIIYRRSHSVSTWAPSALDIIYDGPDTYVSLGVVTAGQYDFRVAAYDSFGKTGLNIAALQSSTTITAEVDKLAFTGLVFTPNSPTSNKVAWATSGVTLNGGTLLTIAAGNATWSSGTLYLYYDKISNTIGSTPDLTVAVQKAQILATYQGGIDLQGGDGTAFVNGSQILAQSIGASQLVADTAIITSTAQIANLIVTEAAIQDGAIANAKIGNIIQSTSYNETLKTGWKIAKDGKIRSYGDLELVTGGVQYYDVPTFTPQVFTWTSTATNITTTSTSITKVAGGTAWNAQAYSSLFLVDEAALRFKFGATTGTYMIALDTVPAANATYTTLDYALYGNNGVLYVFRNNVVSASLGAFLTTDTFEIRATAASVTFYKTALDGVTSVLITYPLTAATRNWYIDSSFNTVGSSVTDIEFGTYVDVATVSQARLELNGSAIRVYDDFGALRVKLGNLV